jgi:type I restriction enzyme S subunit
LAIAKNELTTNQGFRSLLVKDGFSPEFIYYLLFNNVDYLKRHASGSTFQELSGGTLKELEFEIPEKISEQRAIAHILGSLDDKIELNRRMNQTLEATARAIFKSWFVDFDPVRAKAEGRPTGLPDDIAALFPDSFEDSELGEIPKEWEVSRLGNIADVNWGDTSVTKKSYIEEGFLAYSAKGPDGFLPYHDYDRTGVVVSAIGANSGHTWLARGKWSCIKNTIRFWSIDESISTEYLYHATFGKHNWPLRGSAQPFISQGDARSIKVLSPSNDLAKVFGDFVRPFYEKAVENTDEAHTLASLRDTLLPKLISGEMRVLDAEKFVEEAGV